MERDAENNVQRQCEEAERAGTAEPFLARWIAHALAQESIRRMAAALDHLVRRVPAAEVAFHDAAEMEAHAERLRGLASLLEGNVDAERRTASPAKPSAHMPTRRRRARGSRSRRERPPPSQ